MMGGHLLVIEDQGQQGFIQGILTKADYVFWIGLYKAGDGWIWVHGGHHNTSLFEIKGNTGSCVLANKVGYYSGICNLTYRFICQMEAVKI
ncbi:killer cell lectin-like receptor subfamily B member 1B allele C [Pseudophryne corroboree]|uniref:killer cell lectin-like receptor subfamily B member 1B allele C n=1 Tax=Pseudophryne corroboree TaxID=495146 RepID=UPI003081E1ED